MNARTTQAADVPRYIARIDTTRLSAEQRRHVEASLRDGELIAELLLRAADDMHAIVRWVAGIATGLASGIKDALARPVKR